MKGLSIKRIAAIGLGAVLVGSALAPVVSAANVVPTGLDNLVKSSVIDSTGAPAVDVVVGANAAVSDVVWAGNIAARVAQLATKSVGSGTATVDLTVGGTAVLTGEGDLVDDIDINATGYADLTNTVDNGDTPELVDESDWKYDINGDEQSTSIEESLFNTAYAYSQLDAEGVLPGAFVANVDTNTVGYRITFDPALPVFVEDDDVNDVDMTLPFLGSTWDVRDISLTQISLKSSDLSEKVFVGDSVTVNGIGDYDGKTLQLVLTQVSVANEGDADYEAEFELRDGDTVIAVVSEAQDNDDLQSELEDYTDSEITIDVVRKDIDAAKGYVRLDTGDQLLELKDGEELDEDGNDDADKWVVNIDTNTTHIEGIDIYNGDLTWNIEDADSSDLLGEEEDAYRNGPMAADTSVDIADRGLYKFSFLGTTEEDVFDGSIADSVLSLTIDDELQEIPLSFGGSSGFNEDNSNTIEILGEEYTLYYDSDSNTLKVFHNIGADTDEDDDAGDTMSLDYGNIVDNKFLDENILTFAEGDVDVNYTVAAYFDDFDSITYILGLSSVANNTALVVEAGSNVYVDFNGTYVDSNATVAEYDSNTLVPYYLPVDLPDEIFDNWLDMNYDLNLGEDTGIRNRILEDDDQDKYTAIFTVGDGAGVNIVARIDTDSGNLINTADDYAGVGTTDPQAEFSTVDLDFAEEDVLHAAGTPFGTAVSVIDDIFSWSIPEAGLEAIAYLGGFATSEETAGGTEFTGLAVGASETKENTKVTIDAISGASASAVEVVPVGNLVKTSSNMGKSIIVGGWLANAAAKNLQVSAGQDLESLILNDGDYVAAVTPSGSIVVAGMTATDTGVAASELIDALEGLM